MKSVKLYYNPGAGEGENSKSVLIRHIEEAGYRLIKAVHKKKGIDHVEEEADILVVAGGDGTVRSASLDLLRMPLMYSRPIGLLALGTANNIAGTLNISTNVKQVIRSWKKHELKRFDVGRVDGMKETLFFIESFGAGVFPKLMRGMSKLPKEAKSTPEKEFNLAFTMLLDIIKGYKAVPCTVKLDGKEYKGNYILAEVLNVKALGSRMILAPGADPGDGYFDVLLLGEQHRKELIAYADKVRQGIKARFPFTTIRAKDITLHWEGKDMHVDDELIRKYKPALLHVKLLDGMLDFLIDKK